MKKTDLLSVGEASRRLGITLDSVYRLLYSGRIPAEKMDGRWRIPAQAVEARLKERASCKR